MKARLPLRQRRVEGIDCPFPVVRLRVRDHYGTLAELYFRVDTQADFTSIPMEAARRERIPFCRNAGTQGDRSGRRSHDLPGPAAHRHRRTRARLAMRFHPTSSATAPGAAAA